MPKKPEYCKYCGKELEQWINPSLDKERQIGERCTNKGCLYFGFERYKGVEND